MSTALTAPETVTPAPFRSAALDLNLRQKSFVDNYIEVKIGWKAAELAGYSGDRFQLAVVASENLTKPNIRAYYEERLAEMAISPSEVLAEVGAVARFDVINNPDGPIRAQDKLKALELAGKGHRLFTDRTETELSLSDADLDRFAQSLVSALVEASQKARAQLERPQQLEAESAIETVATVTESEDGCHAA